MHIKTVLILGAGIQQVPLILKAKQLNYKTIVASIDGDYPGIDNADIFENADISDIPSILTIAKKHHIDGILTTGNEVGISTIGAVVDKLNLQGTSYNAALRATHKILMKKALIENDVPTAKFSVINSVENLGKVIKQFGYPMIVKAAESSGSRGITIVDNEQKIKEAWDRAVAISGPENVLIEEYLKGIEFGAQAVIKKNKVVEIFLHNDTVTPPPYPSPIGHSMPIKFNVKVINKTKIIIKKAIKALGIMNGIANIDLILVNDMPMVIEIGARMGATFLPEIISIYGGFDAYEHILKLAVGGEPELPSFYPEQANAALLIRSNKTGILDSIQVPDNVTNNPKLYKITINKKPGDYINKFKNGSDLLGGIVVIGDNKEEAEMRAVKFVRKIKIKIKDDKYLT